VLGKLTFVVFRGLFFFEFSTPFSLGGHNVVIYNLFSIIVSVLDVARGEGQVLFGHQKQWSSPLGFGLP